MINLILFGPPGSGKGTQALKIAEQYGLMHISTGDLFRNEMKNETALGLKAKEYIANGELVPDSVTIGMLKNKVLAHRDVNGFIFDGFPRTIKQAEAFNTFLQSLGQEVTALVALQVDDDEIVKRILLRGATSGREDDNDESVIRNRIAVYASETAPVYQFYDQSGKSHQVDGIGSIEEIFHRLCKTIDAAIGVSS